MSDFKGPAVDPEAFRVVGVLDEQVYREKLSAAGFVRIDVEPTRIYRVDDAKEFLAASGLNATVVGPEIDGKFLSAFVRAEKPAG